MSVGDSQIINRNSAIVDVDICLRMNIDDANSLLAACRCKREGHAKFEFFVVGPVVDLRLVVNEFARRTLFLARPSRVLSQTNNSEHESKHRDQNDLFHDCSPCADTLPG